MAGFSFDTSTVEARENNFELIPAGQYPAQVVESDIQPLKSGNGQALVLVFQIVDGPYRGRKLWNRLNVKHTNPEAERIAQQSLREFCDAIGVTRMQDTVELHNKPCTIRVKIREDKTGQYEPQNEVAGYKPLGGSPVNASPFQGGVPRSSAPTTSTPTATTTSATPPWQKRAA